MDDLDRALPADAPPSGAIDYNHLFDGAPGEEGERKVSGKTVPSFSHYVVKFLGAKAAFAKTGTPQARPWCRIVEGPEGSVGDLVSDNLSLAPALRFEEDGQTITKDAETLKKQAFELDKIHTKIARIGKFGLVRPRDYSSQQGLDVYAEQFAANEGFDAIVEIRQQTRPAQGQYAERTENRIIWQSLAALDDPADAKKLAQAGKSALDEARLKIEERNKRLANVAGKTGTAGGTARTSPDALFN